MDEALVARFWCHLCSQMVSPLIEAEVKCPRCNSGFVEEMNAAVASSPDSNQVLPFWAPILLAMLNRREANDSDGELQSILPLSRRERIILISPFNQSIILSPGFEHLDFVLQHLAENDAARSGAPPASKEAVAALPAVKVEESTSCSVCLEEMEAGTEAKEMPCKHRFHGACLLPWLEMHSTCPVCRFQLPAEGEKSGEESRDGGRRHSADEEEGTERRSWLPAWWPFGGLFSSRSSGNSAAAAAEEGRNGANGDEN